MGIRSTFVLVGLFLSPFSLFGFSSPSQANDFKPSVNVMAPLLVGDPIHLDNPEHQPAWDQFWEMLKTLKAAGVEAITVDMWWGLIARDPHSFDWRVYKRMAQMIKDAGLHWVPIFSFHQLGGNVGDKGYVPVPAHIWDLYKKDTTGVFTQKEDLMFKSEFNKINGEYVSFQAFHLVQDEYRAVMEDFKREFAAYADITDEINISLGPSGELRYPGYNAHDEGLADYPGRGSLQVYSRPAILSLRNYVLQKYRSSRDEPVEITLKKVNRAWGINMGSVEEIRPPHPDDVHNRFWADNVHFSAYGKDFFDWQNEVLVRHGQRMFKLADSVFGADGSAFKNIPLGGKFPGVHWRIASDRLAELAAGLIRTSYQNWFAREDGFGYKDLLRAFKDDELGTRVILHFTALEMNDNADPEKNAASRAKTLVRAIGQAARDMGIELKGENALGFKLGDGNAWENIIDAITNYGYSGITLLRGDEIVADPTKLEHLKNFAHHFNQNPLSQTPTCATIIGEKGARPNR